MPVTLEYIGRDTRRRDQMEMLNALRRKYPNLSEAGLHEVAQAELVKVPPRVPKQVHHLIGRDVLAADVTTMAMWPHMLPQMQRIILGTPPDRRFRLIDPPSTMAMQPADTGEGLSRTYVWRRELGWVQLVEDADLDIIRASEARTWFRDQDLYGPYHPARAWDLPVMERQEFGDAVEAKRYERDVKRKERWQGITIARS